MIVGSPATLETIRSHFGTPSPTEIGIAVSGGSDSLALLHLLREAFDPSVVKLHVATVDHGLRAGSNAEAMQVAQMCQQVGLSHTILRWEEGPVTGNLQEQAREARYRLLSQWARENNISAVGLGHTADDQAETVLMRMRRVSGVRGLAAMSARRMQNGIAFVRPLLDTRREDLRDYLRANDVHWIDDPSNSDHRFERVRTREALKYLEPLGLSVDVLCAVADNMGRARAALDWYSFTAARDIVKVSKYGVCINQRQFRTLPDEIAYRILSQAIRWITGLEYPPRRRAMAAALRAVRHGASFTVAGSQIVTRRGMTWVARELNAVEQIIGGSDGKWDLYWQMQGHQSQGHEIRVVGQGGLKQFNEWRDLDLPRTVLAVTPGVWSGEKLLAAPAAGLDAGWSVRHLKDAEEFFGGFLSH